MVFHDKARFESEIFDLKKDMRRKDTEHEKQKAILQQKVELLELQLKESQEREYNIKKMHETLMNALQNDNSSSGFKTPRAYEYSQGLHKREISELRIDYETQIKEMRNQLALKDAQCKDVSIQMESIQIDNQRKVQELELDKRDLENKIKKVELEKQQYLIQAETAQSQTSQIQDYKDLLEEKSIEIERIKIQHENHIQDLRQSQNKQTNENEDQIQRLKSKLNQMENEVQQKFQSQLKNQQDKYLKEVEDLQNQLFDSQRRQREETMMTMHERDELAEKCSKLERSLDKIRNAPQPVTVHLSEENFNTSRSSKQKQQRLEEENDYLNTQLTKISNQLKEAREDLNQYQTNERQLKKEISARLDEIDQQRMDFQRKINEERRKYTLLEDEMVTMKMDLDRKKNEFVSILNDKDSLIQELKRDIDQSKININLNSMMIPQSPIQPGNQSMNASRDFNIGINRLINPRSVSPNISNFPEPKNYLGEPPHINPQASISLQRNNQGMKRYNSGNGQNQYSSFNITNINQHSQKNVNLPMASSGTTQASHNNLMAADQMQTQAAILSHRLTHTELKLYQSCQKMVDAASKMECTQCMGVFPTTYFYDHIVSSQSQCAQIINENQIQTSRSQTRVINRMNQEDFTLCLEEESMIGDNKNIMLESHNNFQNTLQKMTSTARSRAVKANIMNRSKEFIQNYHQKYPQKDKFAMTHGSHDFNMLKSQNNNPNFFRDNSGSKNSRQPINIKQNYDRFVEDYQANESYAKDSKIPKPQRKNMLKTNKSPQNLMLETPSSQDEELQLKVNYRHQISNYDSVQLQHQASIEQQQQFLSTGQDIGYDTNDVKEEDSSFEEDSITKEDRIRRVDDGSNDVGDEGNKSTYLRPSKNNKSANDVNKSQFQDPKKRQNGKEKITSNKKSSSQKYKVPLKLGKNKENNTQRNLNFNKMNTCKARPNNQYPLTFRHQEAINANYYHNQSELINERSNQKSSQKKQILRNKMIMEKSRMQEDDSLRENQQRLPFTQQKGGNRYNPLLRCSQSASQTNNSFVSPKNLMFRQKQDQTNLVDISAFSSQQIGSPNVKDQIQYSSHHIKSTSSGCVNSDLISPQNEFRNLHEQQQFQDYETNENDLIINNQLQGKFQILDPRNQTQRIEAHLDQILMDDDCDLFGNYVVTGLNNGGMTSQRHVGTHEFQPNLIVQQENKFATLSSNNLVVYESQSIQQQETQYQNIIQDQYFTQGSSTSNPVMIQQNRQGTTNSHTRKSKIYNSTQNLHVKSPVAFREQQMYVIRESCPSPLGEDDIIDDMGCPFDQTHGTSQLNISHFNQHYAMGLPSAKQPSQHQDQVVHILPLPKFIKTLPLMRMRSITQMNVNRQL
ncbi:UNKNOWN [Stylonychia lemnae]|uniref:Uncharacterized protein n=1 Tax=Stylonychia lemnae TaxID=5949 RepID=A0A078AQN2_STYLE|nr:UNKNOWN [Stylonychia lemnae]|eukprot:CDW83552.1 UNKNOWN [Stylonychia lemnae]